MTFLRKTFPPQEINKIKASMAVAKEAADIIQAEFWNPDPSLAIWAQTSTTAKAVKVFENGAAILPKSVVADAELPRVKGFKKILIEIDKAVGRTGASNDGYRVAALLRDIDFQNHQSTNGLWNPVLNRWERWGARDAAGWRTGMNSSHGGAPVINERTFRRIKEDLIVLGLIQAVRKNYPKGRPIWLKPTTELSRIIFEPGYWDQVREKFVPAHETKPTFKTGKKPRGLSARSKEIDEANLILYQQVIHHQIADITTEIASVIWHKLTKPTPLTDNYVKKPFAESGSYRYKRIVEVIGMFWD